MKNSKLKIHFIIYSIRGGGAERVMVLLANNLAKRRDYEVSVITLFKDKDAYSLDNNVIRVSLSHGKRPTGTLRNFVNLFRFYFNKKNRPDIFISFTTLTNMITIPIAKLFGVKIIVEEHNSYLRYFKNRKILSDFTKKILYKKADLLTVLTSFDLDFYKRYGINAVVMPNPCSFKPIKDNKSIREKVIVAVGQLDRFHHKGFDNLIPMMKPILKSNADWKLKILGSGDKGLSFLTNLVKKHDLEDQIIFTGFIDKVSELMQRSSIFILPSRFEGLPMVLLEAMSQGMACIAYNCKTGPSDIIENEINGLLIEDQDKEEMSKHLIKLMENKKLRDSLGENAIKSLNRYDIDTIVNLYEQYFKKIIYEN